MECIQILQKELNSEDYTLSEDSQKKLDSILENFQQAVDNQLFSDEKKESIKSLFKKGLCVLIEEKWPAIQGQTFYSINR